MKSCKPRISLAALSAIVLLSAATGCTGQTVNVAGLPEDLQGEMGEAVAEWNSAAPVGLIFETSGRASVHIRTLGTNAQPFVPVEDSWPLAGYADKLDENKWDIYLDPRLWGPDSTRARRKSVMLHEIGHTLGLLHSETGIMARGWNEFSCIDAEAAAHLGGKGTCE